MMLLLIPYILSSINAGNVYLQTTFFESNNGSCLAPYNTNTWIIDACYHDSFFDLQYFINETGVYWQSFKRVTSQYSERCNSSRLWQTAQKVFLVGQGCAFSNVHDVMTSLLLGSVVTQRWYESNNCDPGTIIREQSFESGRCTTRMDDDYRESESVVLQFRDSSTTMNETIYVEGDCKGPSYTRVITFNDSCYPNYDGAMSEDFHQGFSCRACMTDKKFR